MKKLLFFLILTLALLTSLTGSIANFKLTGSHNKLQQSKLCGKDNSIKRKPFSNTEFIFLTIGVLRVAL
jgi:hypothetical protein